MNRATLNKLIAPALFTAVLLLVAANVASNYIEQAKVDDTRLPEKIEDSSGFQRWIINLKKRIDIEADDFSLKDKNEVYNATFLEVSRLETEAEIAELVAYVASFEEVDGVAISPNGRELLDYRHLDRDGYTPNEVHYYGLREDTLIDTKILTCIMLANCYFDRAYFLDNHTFVISEISRNDVIKADAEEGIVTPCAIDEVCTYTFKLHFVDLINNARYVYKSKPLELNLSEIIQFF
ncbi:hypothetical protein A2886_02635 [candidate division WWE3 bacterium RIFCSPHIGHO2_01_FULL_42_13]|uniref:Uncharacterized protein n=1 Tax=candidate division WWE3 bacterium RIFCSPHIGHO2_01_FULL_42_13 TaxID=1802617 RepID=A0A1F4URT0_UNCKA|nr:MAG: hypothetical protein A2886_02635 [candidate division WWE3 bacterium RIFCSPHIGHO2_01_FULL_42_13]